MVDPDVTKAVGALLAVIDTEPTQLPVAAVAAVHASGHDVAIDRTGEAPIVFITPRPDARLDELSARETDVAMLAAGGFSNRQIATTLFISVATVKDHMHSILAKTGLTSRTQLAAAWYGGLAPQAEGRR